MSQEDSSSRECCDLGRVCAVSGGFWCLSCISGDKVDLSSPKQWAESSYGAVPFSCDGCTEGKRQVSNVRTRLSAMAQQDRPTRSHLRDGASESESYYWTAPRYLGVIKEILEFIFICMPNFRHYVLRSTSKFSTLTVKS
jgi:hypothetical protein